MYTHIHVHSCWTDIFIKVKLFLEFRNKFIDVQRNSHFEISKFPLREITAYSENESFNLKKRIYYTGG